MKLLTLNTHSWREEHQEEKIEILAQVIANRGYDLIAFQEVNQMTDGKFLADGKLRENNFMIVLQKKIVDLGGPKYFLCWEKAKILNDYYEEGIGFLSKAPILEEHLYTVSTRVDENSPKARKILRVTTMEEGKLIDSYSCHFGWWYDEVEPFKLQWDELCKVLRKDRLSLLLGDFNNNANLADEGYDYMRTLPLWDSYLLSEEKDSGVTVEGEISGWQGNERGLRIDMILLSKELLVTRCKVIFNGTNEQVVSDHFGVEAEIKL